MFDVIHDEDNALIHTDEELLLLFNERRPLEARSCGDTLRRWRNGEIADDVAGAVRQLREASLAAQERTRDPRRRPDALRRLAPGLGRDLGGRDDPKLRF